MSQLLTKRKKREALKRRKISWVENLKPDEELKPVKCLLEPAIEQ